MPTPKHSPLPLRLHSDDFTQILDAGGNLFASTIATVTPEQVDGDDSDASFVQGDHALLIVTACNAYPRLVDTLRLMYVASTERANGRVTKLSANVGFSETEIWEQARALIVELEGR